MINILSRRVVKNSLWNVAGNLWPALLALITTPYIVHGLGLKTYGAYAVWIAILGILALMDLGSYAGLIKSLSALNAEAKHAAMRDLLRIVSRFYIVLGIGIYVILCGIYIVSISFPPAWMENQSRSLSVAPIVGFIFFANLIAMPGAAFLVATQRYDILNRVNLLSRSALSLGAVGIIMLGGRLSAVLSLQAGISMVTAAIFWWLARHLCVCHEYTPRFPRKEIRDLVRFSIPTFFSNLIGTIHLQMNRLVISFFVGSAAVAHYAVPESIGQRYHGLVASALNIVFPLASSLSAAKETAAIRRMFYGAMLLVIQTAVPFAVMMVALADPFLVNWMGAAFAENAAKPMIMLCAGYALLGMSVVPFYVAWGAGWAKVNTAFSVSLALANGILAFMLIPRFGVSGAAMAFLLSGSINICFILFVEWKAFGAIDLSWWLWVLIGTSISGLIQHVLSVTLLAPRIVNLLTAIFALGVSCSIFFGIFWGLALLLRKGWWPGTILKTRGARAS